MKHLLKKIKRTLEWIPIIWNNFDFDHYYIEEILLYKLERTYNSMKNNREYTDKSSLKSIRIAIECLKRLQNDFYFNTYSKYMDIPIKIIKIDNNCSKLDPNWNPSTNMILYEERRNLGEKREVEVRNLLYDIMKKYIGYWWD